MLKAKPVNGVLKPILGHGIYENEYIKENGIWKFKKLRFYLSFESPLDERWIKSPMVRFVAGGTPDKPTTVHEPYPAQYFAPFHYKHPVTGN